MIELKHLSVRYPRTVQDALSDVSVSFQKGEFVCILGKSGAGKSTFIRCLNRLQKPTSGEVFLDGLPIMDKNEFEIRQVRREMGMIFQHFNLIPRMSVLQNVLTGTFGYRHSLRNLVGLFTAKELESAKQVIDDVGLSEMLHRRVENLSGGQKQRVGIARALVQQPRILLGDEPVASLDPGTANHIFTLLKDLHDRLGLLTVINVHDINLAKRYASRIIALKEGHLIFDGIPENFTENEFHETYESKPKSVLFH
ncbi:phosphonate ABC transporter ATP-binding protein [Aquibacillus sp. 3ASR75-11]|uniref:Phosphonate ABC transporter ATP-binding protein n=1 Tax=Terrihalobacillus insolitus TaxID=2950438 RepID=A0A9X3WUR8_9BACI|nr:phosphonate ABC transporter ATP-binding protein [Terrihalobacillus insolitus]MDC3414529.1 phosphonate ABC transporter ATP-binding protein [Terrihalobacillus insolitus]MDC3426137.1 phosphonate ABC transporter ATP-binding protein [Terrihalobacillus insolitus]